MYFWLKVLHIAAMTVWFAGLFMLPRLFVERCPRASAGGDGEDRDPGQDRDPDDDDGGRRPPRDAAATAGAATRTDGDPAFFNPVAKTLFFGMATPAAVLTILFGMGLIAYGPTGAWLVMKLVIVAIAVLLHLYVGLQLYELGQGRDIHGPLFYRLLGWVPVVLLLAAAALTAGKPQTVGALPAPPVASAR